MCDLISPGEIYSRVQLNPRSMELREFLARVEASGELQTITGANWNLEIGAITEVSASLADSKALLFDQITGIPRAIGF